jgi:prepilin-type N-terminal cleavage/methylation domain-containing protein
MRTAMRKGFTLIETVVTVGIVAAMAAVVIPQVAKQFDAADPTRIQNDFKNIQTAIEAFNVNVKMAPGDLDDLANLIDGVGADADSTLTSGTTLSQFTTTQASLWKGPYMDASIIENGITESSVVTAYGARILDGFVCYGNSLGVTAGNNQHGTTQGSGATPNPTCEATTLGQKFLALQVTGIVCDASAGTTFTAINELFDGTGESAASTSGRVRCAVNATGPTRQTNQDILYFLAIPLT